MQIRAIQNRASRGMPVINLSQVLSTELLIEKAIIYSKTLIKSMENL